MIQFTKFLFRLKFSKTNYYIGDKYCLWMVFSIFLKSLSLLAM